MKISSREYKFMVDRHDFGDIEAALKVLREDAAHIAESLDLELSRHFDAEDPKTREILFLDTADFSLRENGWILRRRAKKEGAKLEFTLKCRTPDRYVAAGAEVRAAEPFRSTDAPEGEKFEEDVAAPFVSRFSRSNTIEIRTGEEPGFRDRPRSLGEASRLFPVLSKIRRDGLPCPAETALRIVNGFEPFERVFKGPEIHFTDAGQPERDQSASVALIHWTRGKKGPPVATEFSFRYEDQEERFSAAVAAQAKRLFVALQTAPWAEPGSASKTQVAYGG